MKSKFPTTFDTFPLPKLSEWRNTATPFFFGGKDIKGINKDLSPLLAERVERMKEGRFVFFSSQEYDLGRDYDWVTNPDTGYHYDISKHWTEIPDLSAEAGDIKFVWEKARFSYLYDIIRYDYHSGTDCAEFVFEQIESFIDHNPINRGPNYKCSQEISLRVLNWTFALYYYKDSTYLTEPLFEKMMRVIYAHIHHVYHNIHFSRISVRNNHAITETLLLYLSGLLFPFLPNTQEWSRKGKRWFEEEIAYQIYEDGTYLQFSMNYHRVVIQLLTWGIRLSEIHNDPFRPVVYERAKASLIFLDACLDPLSGCLPNYGSNDGALFFQLTDDDYRIYSSQLDDLRMVLYGQALQERESFHWYGLSNPILITQRKEGLSSFPTGGYYIMQEGDVKTFIRCGKYKDRPAQSDNLHLDIWANGQNVLWDSGSYKYNTDKETVQYFNGCKGHNTLSVDGADQMLKGNRFIWFYWVKKAFGELHENVDSYVFKGDIEAFRQIGKRIVHRRIVIKNKNETTWEITDQVANAHGKEVTIYWHINPVCKDRIKIICKDAKGEMLPPYVQEEGCSSYYGVKEPSFLVSFKTETSELKTSISLF
ncbi:alginate lyase family protein [Massilibacteroides sp.]|uniref:alginate lyase family protein n=1 Tax=Massilibacteroides sp. TaxID=2034766 RepID=UPI002626CFA2|nr:alginate lyase family protein [Massilibacteroides sp.]MDD4515964.1 alginate lyase family protein [Massilibacteroides sp.]